MSKIFSLTLGAALAIPGATLSADEKAAEKVDFVKQVKPILESACLHCHNVDDPDGELSIIDLAACIKGGENGTALVPGDPDKSPLYWTTVEEADSDYLMPPKKEGPLTTAQTDILKRWIEQGAEWPDGVKLEETPRVDFVKNVQPIFEKNCVSCHNPEEDKGKYMMHTREAAFKAGDSEYDPIIPFDVGESNLYYLVALDPEDDEIMPPVKSGKLEKQEIDIIRMWIAQGAVWPEGVELEAKAKDVVNNNTPDNMELVKKIHAHIVETAEKEKMTTEEAMKPYEGKVTRSSDAPYHMVPIPGGEFLMGSPAGEKARGDDEGPQFKVNIKPFWMGKYEVTWDEYEPYMITEEGRNKDGSKQVMSPDDTIVDMVSQPTPPYQEMSFGMGTSGGYPAISMTQHAANKYCQWLSAQTGHFYRLPTEAEWEYACRAGTTTAYHFGDDPKDLDDYAWHFKNSKFKYQKVGQKKPNPWGLYDMHGNVMEWTLDQYVPEFYGLNAAKGGVVDSPWAKPTQLYPRTAKGGSYDDDPEALRSAARMGSNENWKQKDPQLPKSIWYHTDATWLGFRIVRPLEIPTPEEMYEYWFAGIPKE